MLMLGPENTFLNDRSGVGFFKNHTICSTKVIDLWITRCVLKRADQYDLRWHWRIPVSTFLEYECSSFREQRFYFEYFVRKQNFSINKNSKPETDLMYCFYGSSTLTRASTTRQN